MILLEQSFWRVSADDCLWRPFYTAAPLNPWWQPYQAASAPALKRRTQRGPPKRMRHADTPRHLCWAGACVGPDGAAAIISLRERYAVHARASKLLLQKHATAEGTTKIL
jgi:hypothetical protein